MFQTLWFVVMVGRPCHFWHNLKSQVVRGSASQGTNELSCRGPNLNNQAGNLGNAGTNHVLSPNRHGQDET
jgi:hypothetical protein